MKDKIRRLTKKQVAEKLGLPIYVVSNKLVNLVNEKLKTKEVNQK